MTLPKVGEYINVEIQNGIQGIWYNLPTEAEANGWAAEYWFTNSTGNIKSMTALYSTRYQYLATEG